jgi:hypothetical protein
MTDPTDITNTLPPCEPTAGAPDLCGAPDGQPCEPGCPSLATDEATDGLPVPLADEEEHYVEQEARVNLVFRAGRWAIDSTTFDGYALDGYPQGASGEDQCECDDEEGHEQARQAANAVMLPTGAELFALLRDDLFRRSREEGLDRRPPFVEG